MKLYCNINEKDLITEKGIHFYLTQELTVETIFYFYTLFVETKTENKLYTYCPKFWRY